MGIHATRHSELTFLLGTQAEYRTNFDVAAAARICKVRPNAG